MSTDRYSFCNIFGKIGFGPGDHLQIWRSPGPGPAHEILVSYDRRCFHSPGPNEAFCEDSLDEVLRGAVIVAVIHRAETAEVADLRIARARLILGVPWDFWRANCQDTTSWIVTGNTSSFQREAIVVLLLIAVFLGIGWGFSNQRKRS